MNEIIGAQTASQGNAFTFLVPFIIVFAIFYFLIIRPSRRRQKNLDKMIQELKPGDRVITSGGICGTVVGISDDKVQLRIADQVKIDVLKSAVAGMDTK